MYSPFIDFLMYLNTVDSPMKEWHEDAHHLIIYDFCMEAWWIVSF